MNEDEKERLAIAIRNLIESISHTTYQGDQEDEIQEIIGAISSPIDRINHEIFSLVNND